MALARRRLRWIRLKNNLPGPASLSSDRARKWLLSQEPKLSPEHRHSGRQFVDQITALERQLTDVEHTLAHDVAAHPDSAPTLALTQSVPGIGFVTAVTILCECGDNTRFDNIDQFSAYAGLCPRITQSGETAHHGHISHQGPLQLRCVLQQAAWVAIRYDPQARRLFTRIAKRAGSLARPECRVSRRAFRPEKTNQTESLMSNIDERVHLLWTQVRVLSPIS